MNTNSPATLCDRKEKQTSLLEVGNVEKILWATIQCKGILHAEVQDLYRKARAGYETIILDEHPVVELQDVEYSLWKLHYKLIDEFRKKIKKVSTSAESSNNLNGHVEGFKLFLSEAAEFYKDLIAKFRRTFGLSQEAFSSKKSGSSFTVEPTNLPKCLYTCHRFLVCLGDLSRYRELCKKPDVQKWAVAASYYLEATTVWPYSGNPQNQLALLATYIGDDFLALYHCVRSLAVKEPFPDALDNITLLFEKNRSSQLQSLSTEAQLDFSKPLQRLSSQIKSHSSTDSTNSNKLGSTERVAHGETYLWPLLVRMISFFLVKSSFEDFPHTLASTMNELGMLLALNDTELRSSLEPYEPFDSSREGPYRALQVVSILIFVIHYLIRTPELKDVKVKEDAQLSACNIWAWTCTFSCLGRFIERSCLTGDDYPECCPLLPAVLVFLEWFVGMLDYAEAYGKDEKVSNAKSYFFGALIDLLNKVAVKEHEVVKSSNQKALWEDFELRGFEPLSQSHDLLDFSSCSDNRGKYEGGKSYRVHRIFLAAKKMVDKLKGYSQAPIFYDQSAGKFHASKDSKHISKKNEGDLTGDSSGVEEEEVILFKPLTRYNSAPIETCDSLVVNQTATSEEGLHRSSSLFTAQNGSHHNDTSKKGPPSAGPPSLSAWVLNREALNIERERAPRNPDKPELAPIEEIPTSSLANMSISEVPNSSPYIAPIPSAPLLPEDPVWLRGGSAKEEDGILGAPPVSRFSNFSTAQEPLDTNSRIPGLVDAFPPPVLGMSSSEWLYRYKNNLNLERGNPPNSNHHWPATANNPAGNLGNFHGYDGTLRFDLVDRQGNPLFTNRMVYLENPSFLYGREQNQRENVLLGYQRPIMNGLGGGSGGGGGARGGVELRAEQPPLLQYLKEREWQLQSESPLRGPPYMGN